MAASLELACGEAVGCGVGACVDATGRGLYTVLDVVDGLPCWEFAARKRTRLTRSHVEGRAVKGGCW